MKRLILVAVCSVAAFGCDGNGPVAPSDVTSHLWQLVSLQASGSTPLPVDTPSRYTLRFEPDGRLSVMSDCNGCGGGYQLSGSTLKVEALQCTLVACPQGSLDSRYRSAIERAQSIAQEDDELIIEGGGETLRFRR